jgi:starvation-inducible DNA-binding protein
MATTTEWKPSEVRANAEEISRENVGDSPVVEQLQRQVANAFILFTNYKHYHWQAYGPHFRDLHLLFDDLATATLQTIDDFAERVRMIGQTPLASPLDLVRGSTVKIASKSGTMRDMVEEADMNLMAVIREMRAAARTAEEKNDPGTNDLFSRVVQIHEKHEWFLREVLRKDDGLRV